MGKVEQENIKIHPTTTQAINVAEGHKCVTDTDILICNYCHTFIIICNGSGRGGLEGHHQPYLVSIISSSTALFSLEDER